RAWDVEMEIRKGAPRSPDEQLILAVTHEAAPKRPEDGAVKPVRLADPGIGQNVPGQFRILMAEADVAVVGWRRLASRLQRQPDHLLEKAACSVNFNLAPAIRLRPKFRRPLAHGRP